MILTACTALTCGPENGVWFRAVEPQFLQTALGTAQTVWRPTRFNPGQDAVPPFEVLYLAEDPQVALFEVGAMLGSPSRPGGVLPHPRLSWTLLNVRVHLQRIADLTQVAQQQVIGTDAQQLTGDWEGYQLRSPRTSVSEPVGLAPTQELGAALFAVPGLEGFRTVSARVPYAQALVLFPQKVLVGSSVEFFHPTLGAHVISGATAPT